MDSFKSLCKRLEEPLVSIAVARGRHPLSLHMYEVSESVLKDVRGRTGYVAPTITIMECKTDAKDMFFIILSSTITQIALDPLIQRLRESIPLLSSATVEDIISVLTCEKEHASTLTSPHVFHSSELLINIAGTGCLTEMHVVDYDGDKSKLPRILSRDMCCRVYGFRKGDVIRAYLDGQVYYRLVA